MKSSDTYKEINEPEKGQIVQINTFKKNCISTEITEISELNKDLGVIQTKDPLSSVEEFGSALTSMDGELLGISMPSAEMNHFLSSKIIKEKIKSINSGAAEATSDK